MHRPWRSLCTKMARKNRNILSHKLRGGRGKSVLCRRSLTNPLLRQIRTNLLYARLRSLVPRPGINKVGEDIIPTCGDETPKDRSDCRGCTSSLVESKEVQENRIPNGPCEFPVNNSAPQDVVGSLPSVRVHQIMGSREHLMISIVTFKAFNTLLSELFLTLEQENLNVVHAHRFFAGDKAFHTIQAKVEIQSTLDVDALSHKLYLWAGNGSQ